MLQGEGYQVFEASDGMEALQVLSANPIDLTVVDLFLPGRDGIEIAREIGKQSPLTKILLLTAYSEHSRTKEAQQIFKQSYLEKSSLDQVLIKKVQEIFQR